MTGQELKEQRKRRRWSLREAAEKCGVSNAYLYQLETGARKISGSDALRRIVGVYGLPVETLWTPSPIGLNDAYIEAAFEVWAFAHNETERTTRIKLPIEAKAFILELHGWNKSQLWLYE